MRKPKEKYVLADDSIVPGTTTVENELGWNKNILVGWANRLGLQGIESRKYVDDKADIGTLAHAFVLAELKGEQPDTADYTANQIRQAKHCLESYQQWKSPKKIEPILVETRLVSETYRYGGTADFYGKIDGVLTLLDYKTGKGIWPEFAIQVAAYRQLLREHGREVNEVRILSIPRSEDESFSEKVFTERQLNAGWEIFKHLLGIWGLKREINPEK